MSAQVSPGTADQKVAWKSTAPSYVAVDANGRVYGKKVGQATVTATAQDGTKQYESITIRVITPLTVVKLPETEKLFRRQGEEAGGDALPLPARTFKALAWTSGNESVATVDEATGLVTAVATGDAVITATAYNGLSDSCTVTVTQPVTRIDVSAENAVLYKGKTMQLTAVVYPDDAGDKGLTWKSLNTKYAAVDAQGLVTGRSAGKVMITATAKDGSGVAGSVTLTVASPEKAITLSRTSACALPERRDRRAEVSQADGGGFAQGVGVQGADVGAFIAATRWGGGGQKRRG